MIAQAPGVWVGPLLCTCGIPPRHSSPLRSRHPSNHTTLKAIVLLLETTVAPDVKTLPPGILQKGPQVLENAGEIISDSVIVHKQVSKFGKFSANLEILVACIRMLVVSR